MRNRFHSLCPYFAMFPESFAARWINRLTRPGDTILDPFSGRGTTALTATLAGRCAVSCDVNDVAFCLTKAKTNAPVLDSVVTRLAVLKRGFESRKWARDAQQSPEFFQYAYSADTLSQLLYLRESLEWRTSRVDNMLAALVLGSLHGESRASPNYFSNQMPRTISTKPAYSVRFWQRHAMQAPARDVFEILRGRAAYRYESPIPRQASLVLHTDMRNLPRELKRWTRPIRCVITSPPYLNVTNFEEDQWLRLWFLGGPPHPTRGRVSRDDRYERPDQYWSFVADLWRSLGAVLAADAHVVIRIGSRSMAPKKLKQVLSATSQLSKRKVHLISARVSQMRNRQTDVFNPGSTGCSYELDCHFRVS